MISYKCKNCAGEMSISANGELYCPYCGSKNHFSDIQLRDYKEFRKNMLDYLRAEADLLENAPASRVWDYKETVHFKSVDEVEIDISYLFYNKKDGIECYVAKDSVIYILPVTDKKYAEAAQRGLGSIDYPSAALKDLSRCFPNVKSIIELEDKRTLIAFSKQENAYPLYAFGNLKAEHVAWIISRLENICCIFEYSGICHNGISIDSVFINPRTHEAFLIGDWWKVGEKSSTDKTDLVDLRKTALKLLGDYRKESNKLFIDFLEGRPEEDAYSDFEKWDRVIEKGFGGHKFVKFNN